MNRRLCYSLVVTSVIVLLFISAYLTNLTWLWILASIMLAITVILVMRHYANQILDENQPELTSKRGRMHFLPRPSGLGSQAGVSPTAGTGSNMLVVKQEKAKNEQVGEIHAYLPESAWASTAKKDGEEKDS